MAASFGLAGLTACRRPEEHILPAIKGIEDYIPGQAVLLRHGHASGRRSHGTAGRDTRRPADEDRGQSRSSLLPRRAHLARAGIRARACTIRTARAMSPRTDRSRRGKRSRNLPTSTSLGRPTGSGLRFLSERVLSPSLEAVRKHVSEKWPKANGSSTSRSMMTRRSRARGSRSDVRCGCIRNWTKRLSWSRSIPTSSASTRRRSCR